jgi:UDP-2,4-diacetamido-2,4,6-trideoxy-beta-L-altropyranose hydrolase
MRVAFRCDASVQIGSGHVMRCLTLAEALAAKGAECHFICREHPGHLLDVIRQRGFLASALPIQQPLTGGDGDAHIVGETLPVHASWLGCSCETDAEQTKAILEGFCAQWLVIDHYALDHRWEMVLRPFSARLLVIDDLADRTHSCDLLLDQNLGRRMQDYVNLIPDGCDVLAGPQYALLRPEFVAVRPHSLERRREPELRHILITMGGVDLPNATTQVLEALQACALREDCRISVVMGTKGLWLDTVREMARRMPWQTEVLVNIGDMAQRMAYSDLIIGGAGTTSLEWCSLGVPALVVVLAENQRSGAMAMAETGCAVLLGEVSSIKTMLKPALDELNRSGKLGDMGLKSSSVTDGLGVERVVEKLTGAMGLQWKARLASADDEQLLLTWANDPTTRRNSFSPEKISSSAHHAWLKKRLQNRDASHLYIIESTAPVGQVRFDRNDEGEWEIDYSIAVEFRGKGCGKLILSTALQAFRKLHPEGILIGKVKMTNTPSCRIFEALSFSGRRDDKAEVIVYRQVLGEGP